MNWSPASILLPLFSLTLISVGIFLLFYKRKIPAGVNPIAWIDELNAPTHVKDVLRKEATKQTARIFTLAWVREYWQGNRTALSAFFCWFIYIPLLLITCSAILIASNPSGAEIWMKILSERMEIVGNIYLVFVCLLLWKCSKNSTAFWKVIIRIFAAINVAVSIFTII